MSKISRVRVDRKRIIARMEQVGKKAVKGVSGVFQTEGDKIVELARMYAPVDKHNLEEAIQKNTEYTGINRRAVVSVYVDLDFPAPESSDPDKVVGDYARLMHNTIYMLGPKSREKEMFVGIGKVGTGYLSRAVEERRAHIYQQAAKKVQKLL